MAATIRAAPGLAPVRATESDPSPDASDGDSHVVVKIVGGLPVVTSPGAVSVHTSRSVDSSPASVDPASSRADTVLPPRAVMSVLPSYLLGMRAHALTHEESENERDAPPSPIVHKLESLQTTTRALRGAASQLTDQLLSPLRGLQLVYGKPGALDARSPWWMRSGGALTLNMLVGTLFTAAIVWLWMAFGTAHTGQVLILSLHIAASAADVFARVCRAQLGVANYAPRMPMGLAGVGALSLFIHALVNSHHAAGARAWISAAQFGGAVFVLWGLHTAARVAIDAGAGRHRLLAKAALRVAHARSHAGSWLRRASYDLRRAARQYRSASAGWTRACPPSAREAGCVNKALGPHLTGCGQHAAACVLTPGGAGLVTGRALCDTMCGMSSQLCQLDEQLVSAIMATRDSVLSTKAGCALVSAATAVHVNTLEGLDMELYGGGPKEGCRAANLPVQVQNARAGCMHFTVGRKGRLLAASVTGPGTGEEACAPMHLTALITMLSDIARVHAARRMAKDWLRHSEMDQYNFADLASFLREESVSAASARISPACAFPAEEATSAPHLFVSAAARQYTPEPV